MMRRSLLLIGLLAMIALFGANVAQACGGCWVPQTCYHVAGSCCYVAGPCYCYTPTCSYTYCCDPCCNPCCDPCCGCSCCYPTYRTYRCYYRVAPGQAVSGCPSCTAVPSSPNGAGLKPTPEKMPSPR